MRVRRLALLVAVGSAVMAGGCVTIPSLEGNRIAISDVVERVKCDLADALPDPYKYPWMANWVAKVDLTLIVNEQAGLTPTVSLVKFRGPAQSGSLAAASRVRTHTLAIVMASPRNNKTNNNDFATEALKLQFQQLIQTPVRP